MDFNLLINGARTEGVITDTYTNYSSRSQRGYVTASFADSRGEEYRLTKINNGVLNPIINKGDSVTIFYNPNNPSNAIIFSFFTLLYPILMLPLLVLIIFLTRIYLKKS